MDLDTASKEFADLQQQCAAASKPGSRASFDWAKWAERALLLIKFLLDQREQSSQPPV